MAFNAQSFEESVSAVTSDPSVVLGTYREEAGELYRYVYSLGQASVGYGAAYSGTSGKSVAATGAISGDLAAGFVKHATLTTGTYGWLLVKGVLENVPNGMAGTALAANDVVGLAANGKVCVHTATSVTNAGVPCGKVLAGCSSGGTGASLVSALMVQCF